MESQNFAPQRHQITANSPIQSALEAVSQPVSAEGTDAATGPAIACARSIDPDGYYQGEYAPGAAAVVR